MKTKVHMSVNATQIKLLLALLMVVIMTTLSYSKSGKNSFKKDSLAADSTAKFVPCIAPNPNVSNGYTCGPGNVTLSASAGGSAPMMKSTQQPIGGGGGGTTTFYWYNSAGTQVGTGPTYTFYLSSGTATYYAAVLNSSGCWSGQTPGTGYITSVTTSNAGGNIALCSGTSTTLGANTPATGGGTGTWSVSSGPSTSYSQFSNVSSPTATFTPAGGYGNYVLTWTITNSPCSPSSSSMTVSYGAQLIANAGPSQQGIATCGLTTVTLAANQPSSGSAIWTLASDSPTKGGSFSSNTSNNSTFTGVAGKSYDLVWTVTNGPCVANSEMSVTFNQYPSGAVAGSNQTICGSNSATLNATSPAVGTGQWSVSSGPSMSLS